MLFFKVSAIPHKRVYNTILNVGKIPLTWKTFIVKISHYIFKYTHHFLIIIIIVGVF